MKLEQDKEKQVVQGKRPRVKLTAAEKSELFAEGVVTVIIMREKCLICLGFTILEAIPCLSSR